MTRQSPAKILTLINRLDRIVNDGTRTGDFVGTLRRLEQWKEIAIAEMKSQISEEAASALSRSGNFRQVFHNDFATLEREAHRHKTALHRLELSKMPQLKNEPKADFAVITIREDENDAVLKRMPNPVTVKLKNRAYATAYLETKHDTKLRIAALRLVDQGPVAAQDAARDMIEDLNPRWLSVVGICGAVPDTDFTLGDVVVASRVRSFMLGVFKTGAAVQFSDLGGPLSKTTVSLVGAIKGLEPALKGWQTSKAIGRVRPPVNPDDDGNFYGSERTRSETKAAIMHHFKGPKPRTAPIVTVREIGSSAFLIKRPEIIKSWRHSARHLAAVEMESAGVYEAARRVNKEYPILAVRGISDIVGFKRDDEWTKYACETAASFFFALIRNMPQEFLS